ncbi:MAG: hypothetical protein J1F09_07925 [Oscillospiraceae bacterium]|nr:hypothetical protein [Oscillospiraceae bacterium]
MKKIISLGIASAVLALTAVSASAEIAPVLVGAPVEGSTYEVNIVSDEDIVDFQIKAEVTGATITKSDIKMSNMGSCMAGVKDDGTINLLGSAGADKFIAGETLATLTFTVTGAEGEDFSIKLTGEGASADAFTATIEKGDGTQTPGQSGTGTQTPGDKDNPETGIALAVVPAVLAGAAVVVAKKRK